MKKFIPLWCLLLMSSGYADVVDIVHVEDHFVLIRAMKQLYHHSMLFCLLFFLLFVLCDIVSTKLKQKRDKIGIIFLLVEFTKYIMGGLFMCIWCLILLVLFF
jgi:hypothetical protein